MLRYPPSLARPIFPQTKSDLRERLRKLRATVEEGSFQADAALETSCLALMERVLAGDSFSSLRNQVKTFLLARDDDGRPLLDVYGKRALIVLLERPDAAERLAALDSRGQSLISNLIQFGSVPLLPELEAYKMSRQQLIAEILEVVANPMGVTQNYHGTCAVTSAMACYCAARRPSEFLRVMRDLLSPDGLAPMEGAVNTPLKRAPGCIQPDKSKSRNVVCRIFQAAAMCWANSERGSYDSWTDKVNGFYRGAPGEGTAKFCSAFLNEPIECYFRKHNPAMACPQTILAGVKSGALTQCIGVLQPGGQGEAHAIVVDRYDPTSHRVFLYNFQDGTEHVQRKSGAVFERIPTARELYGTVEDTNHLQSMPADEFADSVLGFIVDQEKFEAFVRQEPSHSPNVGYEPAETTAENSSGLAS